MWSMGKSLVAVVAIAFWAASGVITWTSICWYTFDDWLSTLVHMPELGEVPVIIILLAAVVFGSISQTMASVIKHLFRS